MDIYLIYNKKILIGAKLEEHMKRRNEKRKDNGQPSCHGMMK
jgi:hypothetical protein